MEPIYGTFLLSTKCFWIFPSMWKKWKLVLMKTIFLFRNIVRYMILQRTRTQCLNHFFSDIISFSSFVVRTFIQHCVIDYSIYCRRRWVRTFLSHIPKCILFVTRDYQCRPKSWKQRNEFFLEALLDLKKIAACSEYSIQTWISRWCDCSSIDDSSIVEQVCRNRFCRWFIAKW